MTPNITATSSPSLLQTHASPRPTAGPAQEQVSAGVEGGIRTPSLRATATSTATPSTTTATPTARELSAAAEELNRHFQNLDLPQTNLQFSMDDQSGEMVVKVMDVEKEEVIRQIPPEEALALAAFFKEQAEKESQGINLMVLGTNGSSTGVVALEGLLLRARV